MGCEELLEAANLVWRTLVVGRPGVDGLCLPESLAVGVVECGYPKEGGGTGVGVNPGTLPDLAAVDGSGKACNVLGFEAADVGQVEGRMPALSKSSRGSADR